MVTDEFVMVHPSYFDVLYEINPYMGGDIDKVTSRDQWRTIRETLLDSGATVHTVRPDEIYQDAVLEELPSQLPDMVFAANHGAFIDSETFLRATFANDERKGEEGYITTYISELVEDISVNTTDANFEGYGDVYRDQFSETLWLGYGPRSDYEYTEHFKDDPFETVPLELTNDWFYHLDTCLFVLDEETALIEEAAFTETTIDKISARFETVHTCDSTENTDIFMPCNAVHLPDDTILTVPDNAALFEDEIGMSEDTMRYVEASEYHKAGGSIRCLLLPIEQPPEQNEELEEE